MKNRDVRRPAKQILEHPKIGTPGDTGAKCSKCYLYITQSEFKHEISQNLSASLMKYDSVSISMICCD